MADGADYKIIKHEKGPLQRFKNQNMLLKKFGEVGLQVYKAITGKRTTEELRKDLGMDEGLFAQIIDYMRDAGMIELEPASAKQKGGHEGPGQNIPQERFELGGEETPAEEQPAEEQPVGPEIPEEEEAAEAEKPAPEIPFSKKKGAKVKKREEEAPEKGISEELAPEIAPILPEEEEPKPARKGMKGREAGKAKAEQDVEIKPIEEEDEIKPISNEEGAEAERDREEVEGEREATEGAERGGKEEEGETNEEEVSEEAPAEEEEKTPEESGIEIESEKPEDSGEAATGEEEITPSEQPEAGGAGGSGAEAGGMSPVEKIISDKYGDVGLQVYTLIDGQRTAEEIMRETGLTESKLVEILDFMDEQGIIKLDYPKAPPGGTQPSAGRTAMGEVPPPAEESKESAAGFNPMIEGEEMAEGAGPVPSPLETPIKAPLDFVKSMQMKAKIMLKYGEKGGKILDRMDGKNDMIDIALALDMPLYTVKETVDFMMQNGMVIIKPAPRADVRKKYGEDGYAVYKRYGKEGLMFYELIGKELTIKQMAEKITKDKSKIVEMFMFIHKVLGIEIPIDQDALKKQLGI